MRLYRKRTRLPRLEGFQTRKISKLRALNTGNLPSPPYPYYPVLSYISAHATPCHVLPGSYTLCIGLCGGFSLAAIAIYYRPKTSRGRRCGTLGIGQFSVNSGASGGHCDDLM
jgi:hypothetical protein